MPAVPSTEPLRTGVVLTSQVSPPSREWNTRDTEPPLANQASLPAVVMVVPLAAKPYSSGCAGGIPVFGKIAQVSPPSVVERIWNLPSTGSDKTRPSWLSKKAMASKNVAGSLA